MHERHFFAKVVLALFFASEISGLSHIKILNSDFSVNLRLPSVWSSKLLYLPTKFSWRNLLKQTLHLLLFSYPSLLQKQYFDNFTINKNYKRKNSEEKYYSCENMTKKKISQSPDLDNTLSFLKRLIISLNLYEYISQNKILIHFCPRNWLYSCVECHQEETHRCVILTFKVRL